MIETNSCMISKCFSQEDFVGSFLKLGWCRESSTDSFFSSRVRKMVVQSVTSKCIFVAFISKQM